MPDQAEVEYLVHAECRRLEAHPKLHSALFWCGRVVIRTCRILCGAVIGLVGWWVCGSRIPTIANKPFATLTLNDVFSLLALSVVTGAMFLWAFYAAFGRAPPRAALREVAASNVHARMALEEERLKREAREDARAARWYKYGRLAGFLFDARAQRRHTGIMLLVLLGSLSAIFLVAWLVGAWG